MDSPVFGEILTQQAQTTGTLSTAISGCLFLQVKGKHFLIRLNSLKF